MLLSLGIARPERVNAGKLSQRLDLHDKTKALAVCRVGRRRWLHPTITRPERTSYPPVFDVNAGLGAFSLS